MLLALLLRVLIAVLSGRHECDQACFKAWGIGLVQELVRNAREDDSTEIDADGGGALAGERHALLGSD